MKNFILILFSVVFFVLFLPGCNLEKTTLQEDSFLGKWYTIKGDWETYSFLKDSTSYIFVGTRNMRPVVFGTWKINKDKFVITTDNGIRSVYNFVLLNDTLSLNDGEQIYTRTEPLEVKYPEVRILETLSGDFSNLNFSAPRPADLNWTSIIESTKPSQNFTLQGFSISAVTTISSGAVNEVSNFLKEYGFEEDTVYVTDICNGFWDDNQIVTVCISKDPETKTDSISIYITSGYVVK
jgi:hypothetical protein